MFSWISPLPMFSMAHGASCILGRVRWVPGIGSYQALDWLDQGSDLVYEARYRTKGLLQGKDTGLDGSLHCLVELEAGSWIRWANGLIQSGDFCVHLPWDVGLVGWERMDLVPRRKKLLRLEGRDLWLQQSQAGTPFTAQPKKQSSVANAKSSKPLSQPPLPDPAQKNPEIIFKILRLF